jgi:hypothetical protein
MTKDVELAAKWQIRDASRRHQTLSAALGDCRASTRMSGLTHAPPATRSIALAN